MTQPDPLEPLGAVLQSMRADLEARARPYAENLELRRRISLAKTYLEELACECSHSGQEQCPKCHLEMLLAGDA